MSAKAIFASGYLICVIFVLCVFILSHSYFLYPHILDKFQILTLMLFSWFFNSAFIISLIAIIAIPYYRKTAIVALFIASLAMLPLSTVMLYGLLRYNTQMRFAALDRWSGSTKALATNTWIPYPNKSPLISGIGLFVAGIALLYSHADILSLFIAPLGLIIIIKAWRLRHKLQLGLIGDNLLITPGFFSDTYTIPVADCRLRLLFNKLLEITVRDNILLLEKGKDISTHDFLKLIVMICDCAGVDYPDDVVVFDPPE
ncbi:hypothetical protein QE94_002177 [Salmonella enterica subsp. enterica]|nr:hypothetical protein [Salmonella enterica subsp. enterica]